MRKDRVRFLFIIFILYSVIRPMICIDGNKPKVLDQFLSGLLIDENSIKDKLSELENSVGDNSFIVLCSMKKPHDENFTGYVKLSAS